MMNAFHIIPLSVIVLISLAFNLGQTNATNVICYFNTASNQRTGDGAFQVEDIDVSLCTYLMYAFVGIDATGTVYSLNKTLDYELNYFSRFNALKKNNTNLKTILSVGGYSEGSANFSITAASAETRSNFTTSALAIINKYGFDGLDVDWEYPNRRDTVYNASDIENYTTLLKEVKEAFSNQNRTLYLSAAVSAVESAAELSYNISEICSVLDLVNVMTYDLHGAWDSVTGHNAALHKGEADGDADAASLFTVDVAIEYWLAEGCPAEKVVLGMPVYGHTFNLTNSSVYGVGAASSGYGLAGPYTEEAGILGYLEYCYKFQKETWALYNDTPAKVPYAVQGYNWLSYEDTNSLTAKVEWGLAKNISNFMVWSIDLDDFSGICGETYPMMKAINAAINN